MSTQQDIYAVGSENRPPMLNKENYVPWSSCLLRYAKSIPNGKLIYNSIMNGPYVRRMIPEPGDADREVPVNETFHEQTDDELTKNELKQEIWLRVQQMMKGSDIGIKEKKANLFNEWERFTSTDGESIESYYHRFSKLINDFKRNKHFPEKIASNLKFLNNLQPEWSRHYTQKEVDDLRVERLAKTHDPLALMANSNNPFNYPVFHQDQPSSSTYMQQPLPNNNNNYNPQPSFNQNYMQQPMPNPEDITDPTTVMNMALISQPGMNMGQDRHMQMVRGNGGNLFRQYAGQNVGNQNAYNAVQNIGNQVVHNSVQNPGVQNVGNQNRLVVVPGIANQNPNRNGNVVATQAEGNAIGNNGNQIRCYNCRGLGHLARNCTVRPRRRDVAYLQTQLLIAQKEEAGIQLKAKEFDLMVAAADLDKIEEVNANCILMANLQQASTSGTQTDKAPVYDSNESAEVHNYDNCYDNEIFNMFTQEEQYTELLEPIPEPHQVQQNDSNVIFEVSNVEQDGGTVDQHPATVEETHAYFESLYNNLAIEVEKVNSVNRKMKETNADLTTELARYKNQEKCFEISQEKYDKLERCYQKSVYQEQCLTKKRNALHLSSDELLDIQIQLENKIKELDNILVKTGQSIQMMHMLSPKTDSFYYTEQKMALGYQNPFYLKQAQQKQQSLYNGKVLLEKHDPPTMHDSEETLQLAQESRLKMKQLNKEIKPANYTKINHLSGVFVSQTAKSQEDVYFSNTSKTANVSKPISIPNEEFSDDTTPSVARKFLNEVKSTIVTLQRVVKQKMTLDIHNWSSFAHQEIHKIIKDEIFPIVNQVDDRVQNFEIKFLKEAAKFVRDFKSLAKEADESLAKHKALELEIERLLRAVENEYAKLWNDWYKKCEECKYDKISYDKAYNDMQQKIERLQAQLGDQKGKSKDTSCVSNTLDPLSQKLENENVELEFQLRAQLFDKASEQKDIAKGTSVNTQFCKQLILGKPPSSSGSKLYDVSPFLKSKGLPKIDKTHTLINPFKPSKEEKHVPNKVRASVRRNQITVSQPHVIPKKDVNSDSNGLSSTGVDNTAKTRRPQPRSNTRNDRVPSMSKSSCSKNKEVEVEEHPRNLLLSENKKHMSSECNHVKLAIRNVNSKVFCAMCKQCLITANYDVCVFNYVNDMNYHSKKQKENVSNTENQKKQKPKVMKPKKVGSNERLASPKPAYESESQSDSSNGDNACTSNPLEKLSHLVNLRVNQTISKFYFFSWQFLGTVRFGNDHVAAILGFGDLQWGNILITRVYFVEGLGHNLFSVGQFCDSDLEVAFRRNSCFVRNLDGVDLLKGNRSTNLYTINLHEMASASPICLMARATSTKSWLWHQRLSHLNFDTINDLAKNDLVSGLPKFKYHKEHLCPSCEQGKSKRASHPPKPVPNSKQRLHLLHMDLCGPMRIASINEKRYVLVIVDDYSHYPLIHFLRSKDEAPEVIKTFLKRITVLLQSLVIIIRTDNDTEFKNQILKEYFDSVVISHQASSVRTPQQNGVVEQRNQTLVEAARTMLIFSRAPLFLWAENDREDIGKLSAKGNIGFFIGYSADSCAYRVYNRRIKKIMETMNVTFDELSAMAYVDGTYSYNLKNLVEKVCMLAHKPEEEAKKTHLRAASLQCLSAMCGNGVVGKVKAKNGDGSGSKNRVDRDRLVLRNKFVYKSKVITKYLVNISKRRAFWSLKKDILKITVLKTNTSYPSRKIRRICACTHQSPQRKQDEYAISSEDQYVVLEI
ncbi:retrovirus-related pol polyprotein from transposon TNT 1-94 [Tanacetum coccineum]